MCHENGAVEWREIEGGEGGEEEGGISLKTEEKNLLERALMAGIVALTSPTSEVQSPVCI